MNYSEALNYINNIDALGSKLGLSRIKALLDSLGNPQEHLKIIHTAGTNGKGSVCSMISHILMDAGYKTALYVSPHLERYNERYRINDIEISDNDFAKYIGIVKEHSERIRSIDGMPTVFEQLTAAAFLYFYESKVDYAVIEVGLGGRFDATNVNDKPILSIITSISFDHTEFLGNTLESIAFEKGGIIKEDCPVALYRQSDTVYGTIKEICDDRNAKLYYSENETIEIVSQDIDKTVMNVKNDLYCYEGIELPLVGEYQIKNCALVLLAAHALMENGVKLEKEHILRGIASSKWNGRMEVCAAKPIIVIDGAHNPDGIHMLTESVKKYFADKRIVLLIGILGDKEYELMASEIVPVADAVVITEPDSYRALSVKGLESVVKKYCDNIYSFKEIDKAYEFALSITGEEDVLLCAGSLYLIGRLRTIITGGI